MEGTHQNYYFVKQLTTITRKLLAHHRRFFVEQSTAINAEMSYLSTSVIRRVFQQQSATTEGTAHSSLSFILSKTYLSSNRTDTSQTSILHQAVDTHQQKNPSY